MAIVRYRGTLQWSCDECGEQSEVYPDDDFDEVWASLKDDGWRAHREEAGWEHVCPGCMEEYRESLKTDYGPS